MKPICPHCRLQVIPERQKCNFCGNSLNPASSIDLLEKLSSSPENLLGERLLARYRASAQHLNGKRIPVTVLYARLSGFSQLIERTQREELHALVERLVFLITNTVFKYEGALDTFNSHTLLAIFGAPIRRNNHAEMAVRAALNLQKDVAALWKEVESILNLPLNLQIGLHSGQILFRHLKPRVRITYGYHRNLIRLPASLAQTAQPGAVLVSTEVFQQCAPRFDYQELSDLELPGQNKQNSAFIVKGLKAVPGDQRGLTGLQAPMVGREAEFSQLLSALDGLTRHKKSQFIFIRGEAGIGKSRLIGELCEQLVDGKVLALQAHAVSSQQSRPYWLFLDLFRHLFGLATHTLDETSSMFLTRDMHQHSPELLPVIEHLLGLPPTSPEAERLSIIEPAQLHQQIFFAVREVLLEEARRKPIVLLLEDLHWADSLSIDLLRYLVSSIHRAPLLIIATARMNDSSALTRLLDAAKSLPKGSLTNIPLQNLSVEESKRLLQELLTNTQLDTQFCDRILERSAGVPFYLEEILRMLIDQGALVQDASGWKVNDNLTSALPGVPNSLQALILARFDRLDRTQRRILQIASVIGNHFNLSLLRAVVASKPDSDIGDEFSFIVSFSLLVDKAFLIPRDGGDNSNYQFKHVLMWDVIYASLDLDEKRGLHGRVAQTIEGLYAGKLEDHIEILAHHYSESPNPAGAFPYLIQAGDASARKYANAQAQRYYQQAIDLMPQVNAQPQQRVHLLQNLGDVLVLTGEYAQAQQEYRQALESISSEPEPSNPAEIDRQRCLLQLKISIALERQGDHNAALHHLDLAMETIQQATTSMPEETARVLDEMGWIKFRQGLLDEAENYLLQAHTHAQDSDQTEVIASIYNRLGGVYYRKSLLHRASYYTRKSLLARQALGDMVAVARTYNNLGLLAWRLGHWEQALENFRRSIELNKRLGDVEATNLLHNNIGLLLTDMGDLTEARLHLEQSLEGATQTGHAYSQATAYHHLSRYFLAVPDWERSLKFSQRALDVFQQIGFHDAGIFADLHASIGEARLAMGDLLGAQQSAEFAQQFIENSGKKRTDARPEMGRILRLLGNIAQEKGNLEEANRLFISSRTIHTELQDRLGMARALVSLARLARIRNDRPSQRKYSRKARAIFSHLGAKLDLQLLSEIEA